MPIGLRGDLGVDGLPLATQDNEVGNVSVI